MEDILFDSIALAFGIISFALSFWIAARNVTLPRIAGLDQEIREGIFFVVLQVLPGMSGFVLEDGVICHTYSAYARGLDALWGVYQWLDRAPRGRNETGNWFRRHDEY